MANRIVPRLKLNFNFDLLCPHSYFAYQILQQKLPQWRQIQPQFEVEYHPVLGPKIFKAAHGSLYDGVCKSKRDYIVSELKLIADLYNLPQPKHLSWDCELLDKRSVSAMLFLVHLKREAPELYEPFMQAFWKEIWLNGVNITKVARILKIGRLIGIEFRVMDDLCARIEKPINVKTLLNKTNSLVQDNALSTPWFELFNPENPEYAYEFTEIGRLETVDDFLKNTDLIPERRPKQPDQKPRYPSAKSTFVEDYSC
uniref:DSBA domain-containing protein n=1 Tax=Panagrellus redivivus TaxID=6233 RepID=A0A7E5A027_PANRE